MRRNAYKNVVGKAHRTWRGKCLAKWYECHFAQQNSRRVRMIFAQEILICAAEENIYHISTIRANTLTLCVVTGNFAHCLRGTRVHTFSRHRAVTCGRYHGNMNTYAPKAVSKILSDTADGENFGTNGRKY